MDDHHKKFIKYINHTNKELWRFSDFNFIRLYHKEGRAEEIVIDNEFLNNIEYSHAYWDDINYRREGIEIKVMQIF
jgi:hypothetical protein